jgi:hypothetical protein
MSDASRASACSSFNEYGTTGGGRWMAFAGGGCSYSPAKVVVTVTHRGCNNLSGNPCKFAATTDRGVVYHSGGSVANLSSPATSTCYKPSYVALDGGYYCRAYTASISIPSKWDLTWGESTSIVYNAAGDVVYKKSWASPIQRWS